jgi:hypothetical protein
MIEGHDDHDQAAQGIDRAYTGLWSGRFHADDGHFKPETELRIDRFSGFCFPHFNTCMP